MTRKEEIEKASENRADQYSHPYDWNECYHHFKEGAEWADSHPVNQWHKVEDELPPRVKGRDCAYSIQVLVTDGINISTNKYNFRRDEWTNYPSWFNEITHWMLPELPKEE